MTVGRCASAVLVLVVFGIAVVPAAGQTIEKFAASLSGKYIAYVVEKQHEQEVWLKTQGGRDRLLLSSEQLREINYVYASVVSDLAWSPSERFLSIGVYDGDVGIGTALFDVQRNTYEELHPEEGYSYNAQWHPSKDLLLFQAGMDEGGHDPVIYLYDCASQKKSKIHLEHEITGYQPVTNGVVVKVTIWSTEFVHEYREELIFIPYSSFK